MGVCVQNMPGCVFTFWLSDGCVGVHGRGDFVPVARRVVAGEHAQNQGG